MFNDMVMKSAAWKRVAREMIAVKLAKVERIGHAVARHYAQFDTGVEPTFGDDYPSCKC